MRALYHRNRRAGGAERVCATTPVDAAVAWSAPLPPTSCRRRLSWIRSSVTSGAVAELADAADLNSAGVTPVRVRIPAALCGEVRGVRGGAVVRAEPEFGV